MRVHCCCTLTLDALAEIGDVIDEEPVVGVDMLRLLADAARTIFTPIGQALAHALPPAPRHAWPVPGL